MKLLSAFINGLFLFAVVATATAQTKNLLPVRIIYYVAILLWPARKEPLLEDYKTVFCSEGIGGNKAGEQLYLIATLVYVNFPNEAFFKNSGNISVTSIKGGLRYYATDNVFLSGNAGVGFGKDEVEPRSYGRFIGDIGGGVHFGLVQAGLFYEGCKKIVIDGFASDVQVKLGDFVVLNQFMLVSILD